MAQEIGRIVLHTELQDPGAIIAKRRTELQMSQTEISRALLYKNPNFISMVEKGTARVPVDRALEFAEILEMDKAWFLECVLRNHYPRTAEFLFNRATLAHLLDGRQDSELAKVFPGEGAQQRAG